MKHRADLLGTFAHHKVAANLLMIVMLLSGALALDRLNIQFFPNFALDIVSVRVIWSGASAEDVEDGITRPLEQRLRTVDHLDSMTSTSAQGVASITLEFEEGTDPVIALDQVKQKVDEFRNLPQDAEEPEVTRVVRYEPIARVLLTGDAAPEELRAMAHRFEEELLARGVDKVDINGLPDEEVSIEVPNQRLEELGLSLEQIGRRVDELSTDLPAGILGEQDGARELRSLEQREDATGFGELEVIGDAGRRIELGSIAEIQRGPEEGGVTLSVDGRPAVELQLQRAETGNSLEAARVLEAWLADTRPQLPPELELKVYDESWQLIKERISLLVKNGAGGLALVIAILYLFLSGRVAFWVAVGIPISFMATLFLLLLAGGSINMISLFALIMALGIIVDDAIVVGEDAQAHYQMGEDPLLAAEGGARRMLAPVIASSLTTIAAFLPLMLVGGIIGNILFAIPLVIIAVIIASLIESFLILPGHLRGAFVHSHKARPGGLRDRLDRGFEHLREQRFRPLARKALEYRGTTLSLAVAALIVAVGLLAGGRLSFTFFPSPESQVLYANASFVSGTPEAKVDRFLGHMEDTLEQTERELGGDLVMTAVTRHGTTTGSANTGGGTRGEQLGSMMIELAPPDARSVRNEAFVAAWRENIEIPAGMENFTITSRQSGPPGRPVTVRLTGHEPERLKQAALSLAETLKGIPGVLEVTDDMPYGREQLIYSLTPAGRAMGLTVESLGRQLRAAFDGQLVQIYQDGPDEVEVYVRLPEAERERVATLEDLRIRTDDGRFVPLSSVARWESRQGFEALRHAEGLLAAEVSGDVDRSVNNANRILANLQEKALPELRRQYGVDYSLEGRAADQRETMADMKKGLVLGLILIYLVLAWVFASYGWPLVVMAAIPFGVTGALFGHWVMGLEVTILSMFGLFGLSGIVVNDSIILVTFYKQLREQGMSVQDALVEASCQRLRAVLLTSLTTIAGLTPLLFETSLQAQFLIPMATSIAFGLGFATLLILLVIPALLSFHESLRLSPEQRRAAPETG